MKKLVLSVSLVIALAATQVQAQNTSWGVKVEANMSNFIMDDIPGYKSTMGVGAGIGGFLKIDFGQYFALQPEFLFFNQNSILKLNGRGNDFQYWGMEIPVYAMGQLTQENGNRAYVGIGPYGRLGFNAKNTTADINYYKKSNGNRFMQPGDVGIAVLVGYEFDFGMQINASYKYGLLNQLDNAEGNSFLRNQGITLGIGYRF